MARDNDTIFTDVDIFAKNSSDKQPPPFELNTGFSVAYDAGGGSYPERHTFNNLLYRLYLTGELQTKSGGALPWGDTIAYEKGAIVISDNGVPFYAIQTSTGVNPDTDVTSVYWVTLAPGQANTDFRDSSGQVKVNDGNGIKPTVTVVEGGEEVAFSYSSPLNISASPVTKYPISEANKDESSIYDFTNNTFLEYGTLGGQNMFRLYFTWAKDPAATAKEFVISFRLYNELGSFTQTQNIYVSKETSSGAQTVNLWTIANSASLPSPLGTGKGYKIVVSIDGDGGSYCDITLDNFIRINPPNA
jgi:hypothetical protein